MESHDEPNQASGRNPAALPARIKMQRKDARLSQTEMGERVGVSQTLVSKWENGERHPSAKQLIQLEAMIGELVERHPHPRTPETPEPLIQRLSITPPELLTGLVRIRREADVISRTVETMIDTLVGPP